MIQALTIDDCLMIQALVRAENAFFVVNCSQCTELSLASLCALAGY